MTSPIRSSMSPLLSLTAAALVLAVASIRAAAADPAPSSAEKQRDLIALLQSSAPPQDKAIACKKLAIYGSSDAVPALAALLPDPQLSSWARIALEVIPGPAADAALREAAAKLQGRLLIGVVNSIGVRRDPQAVEPLTAKLTDTDREVVAAAAAALGRVGNAAASGALEKALANASAELRPAIAHGVILCAERLLADGKSADAVKLYDRVAKADVPKQVTLEAIRGAIVSRGSQGLPLLLEQLRSPDQARFGIGLRVARELPGPEVTKALAAEIQRGAADRQPLILLALADRPDGAVLPAVLETARTGPTKLRVAAVGALENLGNLSAVPTLLEAATAADAELTRKATMVLARLPGSDVDADLLARLQSSSGKTRRVLVEVAGQRRMTAALSAILPCLEDADAGTRLAAAQTVGAIGEAGQSADLVRMVQKAANAQERSQLEKPLLALGGRCGAACTPSVLPLVQSNDAALRVIGLHVLAAVGGPQALTAVNAAVADPDESVQDEAVRTLSTWPGNWPEDEGAAEPLLALAKSGKKLSHQVLGLRGYLQAVQEDKKLKDDQKVARVTELKPLFKRPEETRLAIAALGSIPCGAALEPLVAFAADAEVAEDACSAIVNLAGRELAGATNEQRQQALQTVLDTSKNDATKRKAERIRQGLK